MDEKGQSPSKNIKNEAEECLTPSVNAAIIATLLEAEAQENKVARQVVLLQFLIITIFAGVVYSIKGTPQQAIAVLSGGGVSILNGALLAWRMSQAAKFQSQCAHTQLRIMYFYAIERLLVVVVLLAICMVVLKISPLGLLGGFVLGQAVLLASRLFLMIKTDR